MRRTFLAIATLVFLAPSVWADAELAKLALGGLDPVALIDSKETPGLETLESTHGPFRYRFANEENRKAFSAKPDEYGIQFGGACGKMGPFSGDGNPSRFYVHDRRIYVFASDSCRDAFKRDPAKHIELPNPVATGTAEQAKRGAELVAKALTGFGGAARIDGLKSYQSIVKNAYKSGDKETIGIKRVIWEFPRRVRIEEEFTTAYGYAIDAGKGMQFAGAKTTALDPAIRDYGWRQALREPVAMLKHRGEKGFVAFAQSQDEVDGKPVELLTVALDGATSTWSIDPVSGHIVKAAFRARMGVVGDIVVKFRDFRDVDGITLPHQREVSFNGKTVTSPVVLHDRFVIDAALEPALFAQEK